jgi:hypothetical protein
MLLNGFPARREGRVFFLAAPSSIGFGALAAFFVNGCKPVGQEAGNIGGFQRIAFHNRQEKLRTDAQVHSVPGKLDCLKIGHDLTPLHCNLPY